MGSSSSKTASEIQTEITQEAVLSCGTPMSYQQINISDSKIYPPEGCETSDMTLNQSIEIDVDCAINSLQYSTAENALTLSAEAQAGLGFSTAETVADTQLELANYVNAQCADASATQTINMDNVDFGLCQILISQDTTMKQQCEIDVTQDQLSLVTESMASNSSGISWGWILTILGIIVAIIIGIVLLYFGIKLFSGSKGSTSKIVIEPTTATPVVPAANTATTAATVNTVAANAANAANAVTAANAANTASVVSAVSALIGGDCSSGEAMPFIFLIIGAVLIVIAYMLSTSDLFSKKNSESFNQRLKQSQMTTNNQDELPMYKENDYQPCQVKIS